MRAASPKTGPCAPVEAPRFRVRCRFQGSEIPADRAGFAVSWGGTTVPPPAYLLPNISEAPVAGLLGIAIYFTALPYRRCAPDAQRDRDLPAESVSRLDRASGGSLHFCWRSAPLRVIATRTGTTLLHRRTAGIDAQASALPHELKTFKLRAEGRTAATFCARLTLLEAATLSGPLRELEAASGRQNRMKAV